ncbi:hypothetical protein ASO20_01930 [Mycoplasma sp. (ex Biomphalaria glabrata)]|uniref:preprotein translocase subunit SecY n=1 Tax=Mycoplasma sp. (ex Biomphalaria glabrata) TaxID=1749074 RepID=UPI00073AA00E|nr:preprotein translocase subunit SecY [Mycoplasma sp. (ex Biomphalaria glabrata)]ALV23404.1 hypothetical protein ASO20_01930 [Mycoplasma sp. (ex Biomphalaria glabrata)]
MSDRLTMVQTIKYMLNSKELYKKLLFTIGILILFRLGSNLTIPGVTAQANDTSNPLAALMGGKNGNDLLSVLGMLGGGGLRRFSIFALGISPYIMSTIIVQLLSSDVIPSWTHLNKSGEAGRKRLDFYGRIMTFFIAIAQGYAFTATLQSSNAISFTKDNGLFTSFYVVMVLVGGSYLSLWFGDRITKSGLGNGVSLLIFSGIVANLPWNFFEIFQNAINPTGPLVYIFKGILDSIFCVLIFIVLTVATVYLSQSLRKIPVQNLGAGLALKNEEISYLPLRVNSAGVIPVIFSSAILTTPITITQFISNDEVKSVITTIFSTSQPFGMFLYFALTFAFTYFYSHITVNSEDIAENFRKNGTFIPGINPGKDTENYLKTTLNRLNFIGGFTLAVIAVFPYIMAKVLNIPSQIAMGGTGLIILVGVAIDTLTQIQGRIRQKSYSEFKSQTIFLDDIRNANVMNQENKKFEIIQDGYSKNNDPNSGEFGGWLW